MTRLASWADYGTHDESAYPELWRGCVGAWAPCLGPTGTRLHDLSRYRNWGTLTNMDAATDWVVSGGRYALDFDGTNDFVTMQRINAYSSIIFRTVSCWIKVNSFDGFLGTSDLISCDAISGTREWIFSARTSDANPSDAALRLVILQDSSNFLAISTSTEVLQSGVWTHVAATHNGSFTFAGVRLFVNGIEQSTVDQSVGTFATPAVSTTTPLQFGVRYGNDGNDLYLNGQMDGQMLHNRVLSPTEMRTLATRRGISYERRKRKQVHFNAAFFNPAWARNSNIILSPVGAA